MASKDVPLEVQIELLELVSEQEDFQKSSTAVKVLTPSEIRQALRGIASVLRAGLETGAYDAEESSVLTDTVKGTLEHLDDETQQALYKAFGLGSAEE
jgi:hypothetical protein